MQGLGKSPPKIKDGLASAKAVVFVRKNKVLLLKKPNGKWDLPGGWLDTGEAWIDGLAREVYEESGLKIGRAQWIAGWTKKREKKSVMKGVFLCQLNCKAKKSKLALSHEHIKGEFFSLKKIKSLLLPEEYAQAIGIAARKIGA